MKHPVEHSIVPLHITDGLQNFRTPRFHLYSLYARAAAMPEHLAGVRTWLAGEARSARLTRSRRGSRQVTPATPVSP